MRQDLIRLNVEVADVDPAIAAARQYELGIWAAGYEARSAWLVNSSFKPPTVAKWIRVEFEENRDVHSAPRILSGDKLGDLLAARPGRRNWDGDWLTRWEELLASSHQRARRRLRIFCDYSSMPRTVYGTLVRAVLTTCRPFVESITLAYVPGIHGKDVDGSRAIEGLRPLVGTEGKTTQDSSPAFIIGLGYDGILAESVLELFLVSTFACVYARPGVYPDSVDRVLSANAQVLRRAEIVAHAPAWSIHEAVLAFERVRGWFAGRDTILIPLGPKPHVLASILSAIADDNLALRFPQVTKLTPVEVTVAEDARPFVTDISIGEANSIDDAKE